MDATIRTDIQTAYGLAIEDCTPVVGGWLNRKWKARTERGDLLVKQFSRVRFRPGQLEKIVDALRRQMAVADMGIPCPAILSPCGTSDPLRFMDDGTVYMVMTYCSGHSETPETVTAAQMHSLGTVSGQMHRLFGRLPVENVKGHPIDTAKIVPELLENYSVRMKDTVIETSDAYRAAVMAQKPILDTLSPAFFAHLPKGIAHEDFSPDNILFEEDNVSVILDFDRNCYNFLWHDVGRAILSLALKDGALDLGKVRAFVDGYAVWMPLRMEDIADALRITWCLETPWWIQPGFFAECSPKVARFRDEILWVTEHWNVLDLMIN